MPNHLRIYELELELKYYNPTLIARFMGPTWGPSGADSTQVGPILAPWTLLSGFWRHALLDSVISFFHAMTSPVWNRGKCIAIEGHFQCSVLIQDKSFENNTNSRKFHQSLIIQYPCRCWWVFRLSSSFAHRLMPMAPYIPGPSVCVPLDIYGMHDTTRFLYFSHMQIFTLVFNLDKHLEYL